MKWLVTLTATIVICVFAAGATFVSYQKGGDWRFLPTSIAFLFLALAIGGGIGVYFGFRTPYRAGLEEGELRGTGDLGLVLQCRREETEDWKLPAVGRKKLSKRGHGKQIR